MLLLIAGMERAAGWISGSTAGDISQAFKNIQDWWIALPAIKPSDAFGGLGILVLLGVAAQWFAEHAAGQRTTAEPQRDGNSDTSGSEIIAGVVTSSGTPVETENDRGQDSLDDAKYTGLQPDTIMDAIRRLPSLQQEDAVKHYIGVAVQWACILSSATKEDGGLVRLYLTWRRRQFDTYHVSTTVAASTYPGLGLLPVGHPVEVSGAISAITIGLSIRLENSSITYQQPDIDPPSATSPTPRRQP